MAYLLRSNVFGKKKKKKGSLICVCVGGIPLLSIQISKRLTIKFFRLVFFFFGFFFWSVLYVKESELSLQKGKLSLAADRG